MDPRVPRPLLLPLGLAVTLAFGQAEAADPWRLCPSPDILPPFRSGDLPAPAARDRLPTEVEADRFDLSQTGRSILDGDVLLKRGDQWLGAERLEFEHETQRYVASGGVRYEDEGFRLTAREARGDQRADSVELDDIAYQLVAERGNGRAERVEVVGNDATLFQATYSTCDPNQRLWELQARRVNVDREEGLARIHDAHLRIGRVPVLYLPYLIVPVDDRRRTGVLYPTIGQSETSGWDIRVPYYLNLAPNYDATLTPRALGKRGLMLGGEFRYLSERHRGIFEGDWLPDDRLADRRRSYLRLDHRTDLSRDWYATTHLRQVSDRRYFEDFGENVAQTAISFIDSTAALYGRGRYWRAELLLQDWQITDALLPDGAEPYRRLPRAVFAWEQPLLPWAVGGLRSELVAFDHAVRDGGRRIDLKPYLRLPFEGDAWFVRPEFAWRYTAYDLDRRDGERKPTRSLPITSLDMGAFFERGTGLFGRRYVQTLEPRLYYLRAPFREQSDLPIFDTQELTFGYAQLFRDNRFAGADRQSDANQATVALTTRLIDEGSGRERLSASVGQIRYFDAPRVLLPGESPLDRSRSAYVVEADARLSDRWSLGASQQWDPELHATTLSSIRGQYRFGEGGEAGVANLAYRFRRDSLEQAELSFAYPLNLAWRLLGRWNYSLLDRTTIEAFGGVAWESCCMAVRLLARNYVRNREGEKDTAVYFEIELKGLGSFGRDTDRLLHSGILGYSR
jgi:LPS-assembly protein